MTAAVGHPTLRLIRVKIGDWTLGDLSPGNWVAITVNLPVTPNGKKPFHQR
jgi:23S rRNA pseudouridine2457 synthase